MFHNTVTYIPNNIANTILNISSNRWNTRVGQRYKAGFRLSEAADNQLIPSDALCGNRASIPHRQIRWPMLTPSVSVHIATLTVLRHQRYEQTASP